MPSRKDKIVPLEMAKMGPPPTLDGIDSPPSIYHIDQKHPQNEISPTQRRRTMTVDGKGELVRENGLSYLATLLNLLKSLVGAGYLSLPLAFSNAGLWTTLLLIVLFACLNGICMTQLVKCAQFHYRRLGIYFLNYGDMAKITCEHSFQWVRPYKNVAKYIINTTILFLQFGFCSTYYLFIAVSLKEISEELTTFRATTFEWLLFIFPLMVLLNFIRTLRILAFLSTIGNFFMIFSLVFILQFVIRHPKHSIHDLPWYTNFDGLLTASGAIIYSFEAQTLVLPMENKLKRPGQMLGPFGVLSSGLSLGSLIYASIGFFGYIAYGNKVKGSITLNLPQHQISFTLVKLAICVSVFGSFLLQMYVIVEMVWSNLGRQWIKSLDSTEKGNGEEYGESSSSQSSNEAPSQCCPLIPAKFKVATELIFRTFMVTVCFLFAAAVPNLERIIPLVGITSGMLLSFVWPALLDLLNFVPVLMAKGKHFQAKYRICQNLLLACVGIFGMFAGLKANINAMMAEAQSSPSNGTLSQ